ncbi:helix-turn-helix transcriptional regulator [Staphylococcus coagulans]|uniref:helix-turn-helix domain-containing protein n=1 Tax=Staphylococcus coagulans TaxID=74706 RepID=UPI001BE4E30D|nr:helix-turn-helix transcriptional regulator [Staphylococcus coagulans]MBT2812797.1 helix-turn-helix transcriptional regulator [Staphylococcus coagulans]MBT2858524.1 helix-turn-helix transcriptional regulator [Staphylococcus coagulans]
MNEFGRKIKELRGNKSIREASQNIGISHTYLDSLEKGVDPRTGKERKPTIEVINKISLYYDYSFEELVGLANIFVSINDLPKEQKEIQNQKFLEAMKNTFDKTELKVKENYINLIKKDLNVSQVNLLRNVYNFIELETNENTNKNIDEENRKNNIIFVSALLQILLKHKDSGSKEVYDDITKEFDKFLKQYLNIK